MKTMTTIALSMFAGVASGQTFSASATGTQSILSDGPRAGGNTPFFHNAQGSSNGDFAGYAASDYNLGGTGFQAGFDLDSLQFDVQQANAFFTSSGALNFYVASASNSFFDLTYAGDDVLANPGGLEDVAFVGSGLFIETATGSQDTFVFDFDGALDDSDAENLIEAALLNGDSLRWVIAAATPGTSATYGGLDNFDADAPVLSGAFSIPAPGSVALLGLAGIAARRRRG
ncbi:MAG: hypothetical protein AAF108_07790 [Planctomycetota bacterium]